MRGARLGRLRAQAFGRVARVAEAALRLGERDLGRGLLLVQSRDRFARFRLPRIEAGDLFPDAADFRGRRGRRAAARAIRLRRRARPGLARRRSTFPGDGISSVSPAIAAVACAMVCSKPAVSAISCSSDALRFGDLLAQFLDLALGREDAARLGLVAAGDDVLPRNTSPSSVATGNGTVGAMRAAASNESAISAPPITA